VKAYSSLKIGDPLDEKNHVGPLIDKSAVKLFQLALTQAKEEGGKVIFGGEVMEGASYASGCFVRPAIVEAENHFKDCSRRDFCTDIIFNKI